jgi:uncharacterized RDD family membrane protein YckC
MPFRAVRMTARHPRAPQTAITAFVSGSGITSESRRSWSISLPQPQQQTRGSHRPPAEWTPRRVHAARRRLCYYRRVRQLTIETPEHVTLEYELSGLGSRFAAAAVDGLVQSTLAALLLSGLALAGVLSFEPLLRGMERYSRGEPDALAALMAGGFLPWVGGSCAAVQIVYHGLFEWLSDGQTPGKRLLGLRVVREGGQPLDMAAALMRNLLRPIDFLPVFFGLGVALALLTARTQRLGDMLACTVVIRERLSEMQPFALTVPDVICMQGRLELDVEEQQLVRSFLERREQFDPPARARLAARLAADLRRRHGNAGDPLLSAERYLELALERPA